MVGRPRTVVLGFDSADHRLVRQWCDRGLLPAFSDLLSRAALTTFDNEPGLFVGSIWPTLITGVGVETHEFYTGLRFRPEHYDYIADGVRAEPFWRYVSDQGGRVAIMDVPFFPVDPELNGVHVIEWGCHDRYYGTGSHPVGYIEVMNAAVGRHTIGTLDHHWQRLAPCDLVERTDRFRSILELRAFYERLMADLQRKADASLNLLTSDAWDMFLAVIAETHCGGHHLWHVHDETHHLFTPELREIDGDLLLNVYQACDRLLQRHVEAAGPDATVHVIFSHGIDQHRDCSFLLDEVLTRLEADYLGVSLDEIRSRATDQRTWFKLENNDASGAIRLNILGREARGRILPGDQDQVERWLIAQLHELRDVRSGRSPSEAVWSTREHYERSAGDHFPDVIIDWRSDSSFGDLRTASGHIVGGTAHSGRTGEHAEQGLLASVGPGIAPGRVRNARPVDVAPTLLASAGVDGRLPGRVLGNHVGRTQRSQSIWRRALVRR